MQLLRVSSSSDPAASAGAIANGVRETGTAEIQVIGPRAVNQAVKAIAIARGYLATSGLDVYFVPSFASIQVGFDEQERTAIQFSVRTRHGLNGGKHSAPGPDSASL